MTEKKAEVMENVAEVVNDNKEVIERILNEGTSKKQVFVILASMFGTAVAIYVLGKTWGYVKNKVKKPVTDENLDEFLKKERESKTEEKEDEDEEK